MLRTGTIHKQTLLSVQFTSTPFLTHSCNFARSPFFAAAKNWFDASVLDIQNAFPDRSFRDSFANKKRIFKKTPKKPNTQCVWIKMKLDPVYHHTWRLIQKFWFNAYSTCHIRIPTVSFLNQNPALSLKQ